MTVSAKISSAHRPTTIRSPLGEDALHLVRLSGAEGLSVPFRFTVDCYAEKSDLTPGQLVGQPLSVGIETRVSPERYFHGVVSRFMKLGRSTRLTHYQLEIVPAFWLLSYRIDSRIFQHRSVPDILKTVLTGVDASVELQGLYRPRDYCVQYRESDFSFASRLMEEEGIFYFFRHTANGHQMVLADTPSSVKPSPENPTVSMATQFGSGIREDEITDISREATILSGKVTLWDHTFELPHKHLDAAKQVPRNASTWYAVPGSVEKMEVYDFPGGYAKRYDGIDRGGGEQPGEIQHVYEDNARVAGLRAQELQATHDVVRGASTCRGFSAGFRFKLQGHYDSDFHREYQLVSVWHEGRMGGYETGSGGGSDAGFHYNNRFVATPYTIPFRPPRITPKPIMHGVQTAVVVGPAGEEIFTDKYGRVKVQFHWDRHGKNDTDSSCWLRVASPWAGKNWGMIHIPRIGQEVVVDFLEGDPDEPIIVGSVYNADQMPPWKLPENKTMSGLVSRSSLKGGTENYSEFCIEDKKGKELVYLRAEKDFTLAVEHDRTSWVGHDNWEEVDHDEDLIVGHDRRKHVKNDETTTIDGNRTETVQKNETITIHQNRTEQVDKDETITIDGKRTTKVKKDDTLDVTEGDRKITLKRGKQVMTVEMGNVETTVKMGNMTTKLNLGKSTTEALQSIELKVGQSSVKVDQTGVTITGMMVTVNGQVQTQVKGTMVQVQASAMLQTQAGITMMS